jgi:tetratricopeptide (TPR) repeat protein
MAIDLRSCACGSGLRYARCCGLDLNTLSPPQATEPLRPLLAEASAALQKGEAERAEALVLRLLELAPAWEDALTLLYSVRRRQNKAAAAEVLLRRIVALNPNNFWATNELGLTLFQRGALAEAETYARNLVRLAPRNPQAHNLLALVLTESNRPHSGEYHYRQVLALLEKPDAVLLANLAWNLKTQGRMQEARGLYEQSVSLNPDVLQTWLGWARLEDADRNPARAHELLDRAEKVSPGAASVRLLRAVLYGHEGKLEQALAEIDSIADAVGDAGLGANELLEKGRLLDRLRRPQEAFAAFAAGKKKARDALGHGYLADQANELVRRLKGFFTAERLAHLPRARRKEGEPQPIFILGFPRSGTTLLEQMLSAHPEISAGDELPLIHDIAQSLQRVLNSPLPYPEALAELWMAEYRDALDELRDTYLKRAREMGIIREGARWFTDKMPLNETHLGLIALLFPASPLIHLVRHPLDVVLSAYSIHLTHGYFCAFELESIAQHYALIADLVAHYRSEMTLRYMQIRYEDLVARPKHALQRILAHIGVPFHANCLNFSENRRYARTPSYAQVAEPLYDRAVFRYREYLEPLRPVIPILAPIAQRMGYTIDELPAASGGKLKASA